jgi:RNA polymerase sigma-70 factor (ECF subfamily)
MQKTEILQQPVTKNRETTLFYHPEPDTELLELCRIGNRNAFKTLFYMYRSYVKNIIYKITGIHSEHEDLIQSVFMQMFVSFHTFKGDSSFKTWFHRLVLYNCINWLRYNQAGKRNGKFVTAEIENIEDNVPDYETNPLNRVLMRDLVDKAMKLLSLRLRVPLVLNVYSDLNIAEIAVILKVPEGTVKSRLFAARKVIRDFVVAAEAS